jgi:glyoxylase I family protein
MATVTFSHTALCCRQPLEVELFYCRHFGFRRARVYTPGPDQVVMIRAGAVALEIFPAKGDAPDPRPTGAGPEVPGWRHIAFVVDDLDAKLAAMGSEAHVTLGPVDMGNLIPGMRVAWISDPEGNIVELNQGYVDEADPPQAA